VTFLAMAFFITDHGEIAHRQFAEYSKRTGQHWLSKQNTSQEKAAGENQRNTWHF
jgi:hypothetical protein